jgi:hypothetical protein
MRKTGKKLLSALFATAMLMNIMSVNVFAAATDTAATPTVAATDAAATDTAATDAAATDTATTGAAALDTSGATEYHAFMGIQTDTNLWIFRNAYDDKDYGFGTDAFKGLTSVANNETVSYPGTFTDTVIDGDGTYTVSLTDPDFQTEEHLSLLYVSTDIPVNDQLKFSNIIVKFDGNTKYTFKEAVIDEESKTYVKFGMLNNWNPDLKDLFFYNMPPKSVEVTFTVEGFGYESKTAAAAAATPTVAPAADDTTSTDTGAADTTTNDAAADDTADTEDTDGGLSTPVIIGIIAAVVVVIGVIVVVARKKK